MSSALFERTLAALVAGGHEVEPSPDDDAIRLEQDGIATFVLVLDPADCVVCYTVHPAYVPGDRLTQVSHLATLANAELHLAALELDVSAGTCSARTALACGRLTGVDDGLFGDLVADLVVEGRRTYARHAPAIDGVLSGLPADEALDLRT